MVVGKVDSNSVSLSIEMHSLNNTLSSKEEVITQPPEKTIPPETSGFQFTTCQKVSGVVGVLFGLTLMITGLFSPIPFSAEDIGLNYTLTIVGGWTIMYTTLATLNVIF